MRSFVLYCVLVGIPLTGVFMVLETGRGLSAAPTVWGEWKLDVSPNPAGCATGAVPAPPRMLTITQSGDRLSASFDDSSHSKIDGRLHWGIYNPTSIEASADSDAPPFANGVVKLQASFDGNVNPSVMHGTIGLIVCGAPASAAFAGTLKDDGSRRKAQ